MTTKTPVLVADELAAFARAEISFPMTIPGNRVYLAGPMTGHENHNFPAFNAAAERLRASGLEVVNPADHGLVSGLGWADYMRWDLVKLAGCHSVYVLPGWEKSKGASLEVGIAQALGMPVFTVEGAAPASAPVAEEAAIYLDAGHLREVQAANDMPVSASAEPGPGMVPLYAAPQASEAVRDAALEEAAALVGGQCWSYARSDVSELIARHIRALKLSAGNTAGIEEAFAGVERLVAFRDQVLEEAAAFLESKKPASTIALVVQAFADEVRSLKSSTAALSAQPGAQKNGGSDA